MFYPRILISLSALLAFSTSAGAGYLVFEAEDSAIRCEAGTDPAPSMWAMGERVTPAFWGRAAGDAVGWSTDLNAPAEGLTLLVRYSYAGDEYRGFAQAENPDRTLALVVNGQRVGEVPVPDTGSWDLFDTAAVSLPPLPQGRNTFAIASTAPHTVTNIDGFLLVRGELDEVPLPLQRVHLADSESGRLFLRATPNVVLRDTPEAIMDEVERIHTHLRESLGHERPGSYGINIVERARWNSDASAFQTGNNLLFPEDTFWTDKGNLIHETQHLYQPCLFPTWFDEALVQTFTIFDWAPALYPENHGPDNPGYQQSLREANALLSNPSATTDSAHQIVYALRVKYGFEALKRFVTLCVEGVQRGEINPTVPMGKLRILTLMSQAVGEDVTPLFRQWSGFNAAE